MLSAVHKINVAQLLATSGQIADIKIDTVIPGPVHIAQLSLQGISLDLKSGSALLQNVRALIELQFTLDWWFNFGIFSGNGSDSLGSISFPVSVGDVLVPSLSNILLSIPTVTATNLTAAIAPIVNLTLGSGGFTGLDATNASIPTGGFQLSGLGLGAVSISNVEIPQTLVDKVSIQDFSPSGNIVVPNVQLSQLELPSASAADIQSAAPIGIPDVTASSQGVPFDAGVFGFTLLVTPIVYINIASLQLANVTISGSVNQAIIQNISVSVDIRGVNLTTVSIGQIDANNITL